MEWISVKDRLPPPFESVLCYMPGEIPLPTVHEGYLASDGIWFSAWFKREDGEVEYWAEMPEPPKEKIQMYNDAINHPTHYTDGGIETIDFIEAKKLPYHLGNVIKYISRAGKKDKDKTIEDLQKAKWYLDRYIEILKEKDNE